jgi:hypothetical protein
VKQIHLTLQIKGGGSLYVVETREADFFTLICSGPGNWLAVPIEGSLPQAISGWITMANLKRLVNIAAGTTVEGEPDDAELICRARLFLQRMEPVVPEHKPEAA